MKSRPKLRPAMDHSSRFILRPAPARKPTMLPTRTMKKMTLMAVTLGVIRSVNLSFCRVLQRDSQEPYIRDLKESKARARRG